MINNYRQSGFHSILVLVILLILTTVGIVGFYIWDKTNSYKNSINVASIIKNDFAHSSVPQINSINDLNIAYVSIDKIDVASNVNELNILEQSLDSLQ